MPDESYDLYGATPSSAAALTQRESGDEALILALRILRPEFGGDARGVQLTSARGDRDCEELAREIEVCPRIPPPGGPDEAAVPYRYSYSQSRMEPPFWIVKDDRRHLAEVWSENVAKLLVRLLDAASERPKPDASEPPVDLVRAIEFYLIRGDDADDYRECNRIANSALANARREAESAGWDAAVKALSYPNRSRLREIVREALKTQYADSFGQRCSTDNARRLAECALETAAGYFAANKPQDR